MSAQIVSQQLDGLATLRELLELAKNPSAIVEAHESARKQMELTEAQQAKYNEAVVFIQNYEKLSQEIDAEKKFLDSEKSAHIQDMSDFAEFSESEKSRLTAAQHEIDAASAVNIAESERLKELNAALSAQKADADAKAASLSGDADKRESALNVREAEIDARDAALAAQEDALKARIEKMKAAVAD